MDTISLNLIILLCILFLSAFFSGSETALFSLKSSELHELQLSGNKRERAIARIMAHPEKILITILLGNLLVNMIFSAISTILLLDIWGEYGHFISIAIVTPIIIVLCEITPKIIAINTQLSFSKKINPLLNLFHKMLFPLRIFLLYFAEIVIKLFKLKSEDDKTITSEELGMAVKMGESEGAIKKHEGAFIKNVLLFSKKEAANIMYPRTKAVFIPYESTIEDALKIFLENGITRAPVYKEDLDHIVGVLDSRKLLPYVLGTRKADNIKKMILDISHFPASKELGDLLSDFLLKKIQIAIVVDEYGGTAGVVTLSTILSELMGKKFIRREYEHRPVVRKIADESYVISGDMQIEDFNFNFNESIQTTESDTVAGYIIERLGYFPKRHGNIQTKKNILKVKYIRKNRIVSVEVISLKKGEKPSDV
jgi:putative hemolysin